MPFLASFIGSVAVAIMEFFAKYLATKAAAIVTLITLIGGGFAALYTLLSGMVAGLAYVMPSTLVSALQFVFPSNVIGCVSAALLTEGIVIGFRMHMMTIRSMMNLGIGNYR